MDATIGVGGSGSLSRLGGMLGLAVGLLVLGQPRSYAADWALHWENDQKRFRTVFGLFQEGCPATPATTVGGLPSRLAPDDCDADRYYTNGLKLTVSFNDRLLWRRIRRSGVSFTTSLVAGQSIYTPADIGASEFISGDRPYGGWLYGGVSSSVATRQFLHSAELTLGVVGPGAAAGPVQTAIHRLICVTVPRGWPNQIGNRGTYQANYQMRWSPAWLSRDGIDLIPHVRAAKGTVLTFGGIGGTLRFGDIPNDFGPSDGPVSDKVVPKWSPRPLDTPSLAPVKDTGRDRRWYFFYRTEFRTVDWNVFLDVVPSDVRKLTTVVDHEFGVALPRFELWKVSMQITWRIVRRSREFHGQPKPAWFGSFTFN